MVVFRAAVAPTLSGGMLRVAAFWALTAVACFQSLSAIGGGIGIIATGGLGMPNSLLAGGPFTTFLGPGVILFVVIGWTQTMAAILLIARRESGLIWSSVAGFGMIIWIFAETGIIRGLSWLQVLYFAGGCLQLLLVIVLLGGVSWLPRAPLPIRRASGRRRIGR